MKYIIVADGTGEYTVLFDELLLHSSVAERWTATGLNVVSAGFCRLEATAELDGSVEAFVWGQSVSLGKASRPADAAIIGEMLRRRI